MFWVRVGDRWYCLTNSTSRDNRACSRTRQRLQKHPTDGNLLFPKQEAEVESQDAVKNPRKSLSVRLSTSTSSEICDKCPYFAVIAHQSGLERTHCSAPKGGYPSFLWSAHVQFSLMQGIRRMLCDHNPGGGAKLERYPDRRNRCVGSNVRFGASAAEPGYEQRGPVRRECPAYCECVAELSRPGIVVTINGNGFGNSLGNGTVWLGSTSGEVIGWSNSQILAAVTSNAVSAVVNCAIPVRLELLQIRLRRLKPGHFGCRLALAAQPLPHNLAVQFGWLTQVSHHAFH